MKIKYKIIEVNTLRSKGFVPKITNLFFNYSRFVYESGFTDTYYTSFYLEHTTPFRTLEKAERMVKKYIEDIVTQENNRKPAYSVVTKGEVIYK